MAVTRAIDDPLPYTIVQEANYVAAVNKTAAPQLLWTRMLPHIIQVIACTWLASLSRVVASFYCYDMCYSFSFPCLYLAVVNKTAGTATVNKNAATHHTVS